jgi:hypothetical protein
VDPLTGWIDRAADVESLAPRGQLLTMTYAVAFAGGGAKDVTQRWVGLGATVPLRGVARWHCCRPRHEDAADAPSVVRARAAPASCFIMLLAPGQGKGVLPACWLPV